MSRRLRFAVRRLRHLRRANSGMAMVEFAFFAPILFLLGMGGTELANLAVTHMRISQAAMHIADNASRIGERDTLSAQRIFESDINDLLTGVNLQAGEAVGLYENGRVILSSLEQNSDGGQWIHWQRCMGTKPAASAYGTQGTGASGTDFPGMGPSGEEIQAQANSAVMYVEVVYDYQPIIGNDFASFLPADEIRSTAAFTVRNSRDLTQIYQTSPPADVASCTKYETL